LKDKTARTTKREIAFERLVSSAPLPELLRIAHVPHQPADFTWNRVLVFNLGFDRKGPPAVHWVYYPARDRVFYRLGFYDNIFDSDRLSLYVELGFPRHGEIDVEAMRARVLEDLKKEGVIGEHQLVASHSVVMDPAYVHITSRSITEQKRIAADLRRRDVFSIGRYGGWTYCSIEDNIVEARALVKSFSTQGQ
jgi:protoporphyrinogen oxidase